MTQAVYGPRITRIDLPRKLHPALDSLLAARLGSRESLNRSLKLFEFVLPRFRQGESDSQQPCQLLAFRRPVSFPESQAKGRCGARGLQRGANVYEIEDRRGPDLGTAPDWLERPTCRPPPQKHDWRPDGAFTIAARQASFAPLVAPPDSSAAIR